MNDPLVRQRLDKWLWAARFYKTRTLAVQQIVQGRVRVGGSAVKPAREVAVGDTVELLQGGVSREVRVLALSRMRGSAPVAQQLYAETATSLARREQIASARALAPEPARAIRHGRLTKRDRRQLERQRRGDLDDRWRAALDD